MSESNSRSWEEALGALRQAAAELKTSLSGVVGNAEDTQPTPSRLKHDLDRLLRSGAELQSKFIEGFERQRPDIVSELDRERAERTTHQLKNSVEAFATLAVDVTTEVAAAAQSSLKQAEPELRTAVRSLEDLTSSLAAWISASIDTKRDGASRPTRKPPLDEL
jgi:ABC-type transporter Mla subunit MlaD